MATDWTAMEREYVESGCTYADLAERHGVSADAVAHHGGRDGWVAKRRAHLRRGGPMSAPRKPRKAPPDVDGAKLRGKLLALADNWTDAQDGQIEDVGDYRRVVQSVLDLTRAEGEGAPPELRVVMDAPEEYSR